VQVGEVFVGSFQLKTVLCFSKGSHDSAIRGYKTADSGKRVPDLLLRIPPYSAFYCTVKFSAQEMVGSKARSVTCYFAL